MSTLSSITAASLQIPYPGTGWPVDTLRALAHAMCTRHVTVQIVLANPGAICGGRPATDTLARPNGWTMAQLRERVRQTIQTEFGHNNNNNINNAQLVVDKHLRVCGLRHGNGRDCYRDGTKFGLHSKCYIIDECAYYVGSQNLYVCDLAEWGVLVDDANATRQLLDEYWNPLWTCSWTDNGEPSSS